MFNTYTWCMPAIYHIIHIVVLDNDLFGRNMQGLNGKWCFECCISLAIVLIKYFFCSLIGTKLVFINFTAVTTKPKRYLRARKLEAFIINDFLNFQP